LVVGVVLVVVVLVVGLRVGVVWVGVRSTEVGDVLVGVVMVEVVMVGGMRVVVVRVVVRRMEVGVVSVSVCVHAYVRVLQLEYAAVCICSPTDRQRADTARSAGYSLSVIIALTTEEGKGVSCFAFTPCFLQEAHEQFVHVAFILLLQ
jgi:hypothetical protein